MRLAKQISVCREIESGPPHLPELWRQLDSFPLVYYTSDKEDYHNRFGLQAVKQGYAVFAPLDTNSPKKWSWLDRKAITVGQRLHGLEQ